MVDDCSTWRLISAMEAASCCVAAATVSTPTPACSAAAAAAEAWLLVRPAPSVIERAVPSSSVEPEASSPTIFRATASNAEIEFSSRTARCSFFACSATCSVARSWAAIMPSLKTCTASAMWPTSSVRPRAGIGVSTSFAASRSMA